MRSEDSAELQVRATPRGFRDRSGKSLKGFRTCICKTLQLISCAEVCLPVDAAVWYIKSQGVGSFADSLVALLLGRLMVHARLGLGAPRDTTTLSVEQRPRSLVLKTCQASRNRLWSHPRPLAKSLSTGILIGRVLRLDLNPVACPAKWSQESLFEEA